MICNANDNLVVGKSNKQSIELANAPAAAALVPRSYISIGYFDQNSECVCEFDHERAAVPTALSLLLSLVCPGQSLGRTVHRSRPLLRCSGHAQSSLPILSGSSFGETSSTSGISNEAAILSRNDVGQQE